MKTILKTIKSIIKIFKSKPIKNNTHINITNNTNGLTSSGQLRNHTNNTIKIVGNNIPLTLAIIIILLVVACVLTLVVKALSDLVKKNDNDASSYTIIDSSSEKDEGDIDVLPPVPPPQPIEYSFSICKENYKSIEVDIDNCFEESAVTNVDCVAMIDDKLSQFFSSESLFPLFDKDDDEIEEMNNRLYFDDSISSIYKDLDAKDMNEVAQTNYALYNKQKNIDYEDISDFSSVIGKYNSILAKAEIPYAVNRCALVSSFYATNLIRYGKEELYKISYSEEKVFEECKNAIYLYIYDIHFGNYYFSTKDYIHNTNETYYALGQLYSALAMFSDTDYERVKYSCYAIYFYKNCRIQNNPNYTPKNQMAICYNNLLCANYCRNYYQRYKNKYDQLLLQSD